MKESLATGFARRLNDYNTRSVELGNPLFLPSDQVARYSDMFPVATIRTKGGCHVTFQDGSKVSWVSKWRSWHVEHSAARDFTRPGDSAPTPVLECKGNQCTRVRAQEKSLSEAWDTCSKLLEENSYLRARLEAVTAMQPDPTHGLLDVIKGCVGVDAAFLMSSGPRQVDVGVVMNDENLFAEMAYGLRWDRAPKGVTLTVRRLSDEGQFFVAIHGRGER